MTVLLVDDQAMIGEAVRRMLIGIPNLTFHYCGSPDEAIAAAKRLKPTVILQDLVMPGTNGLDLVQRYRAEPETQRIPVIVLSTKEEPTTKSEAFKVGANDYLVKLPDKMELAARIRYHSMAYLNQLQRDEAYLALRESERQLTEKNQELQSLTNVDGLTGLSNRRYFDEYIEAEWKRAIRSNNPLSILMIDVDHFKQYNDTYGHLAGDDVLKSVAATIKKSCTRSTDLAARFGGEEFVIILPETDAPGACQLGEQVCRDIEALALPHSESSAGKYVTISVGEASVVPLVDENVMLLIDCADKALYEAKKAGRNRMIARDYRLIATP
jgi:two-component system chemotaxis family response regulator WspR